MRSAPPPPQQGVLTIKVPTSQRGESETENGLQIPRSPNELGLWHPTEPACCGVFARRPAPRHAAGPKRECVSEDRRMLVNAGSCRGGRGGRGGVTARQITRRLVTWSDDCLDPSFTHFYSTSQKFSFFKFTSHRAVIWIDPRNGSSNDTYYIVFSKGSQHPCSWIKNKNNNKIKNYEIADKLILLLLLFKAPSTTSV